MLFLGLSELRQLGLEDRGYLDSLNAFYQWNCSSAFETGQTKDGFGRFYILCKYSDTIQAICKGNNPPPT